MTALVYICSRTRFILRLRSEDCFSMRPSLSLVVVARLWRGRASRLPTSLRHQPYCSLATWILLRQVSGALRSLCDSRCIAIPLRSDAIRLGECSTAAWLSPSLLLGSGGGVLTGVERTAPFGPKCKVAVLAHSFFDRCRLFPARGRERGLSTRS